MYKLMIKVLGEIDYRKFTIEELQELDNILKDLETEEARLKKVERETIENSNTLRIRKPKEETGRRSL